MARLLDYQFDNFSTDANSNRVIVNAGTLGSSNDAVMHTGQGLEFDGTDDYIKTSFYWSPSDNAGQVRGVFKTVSTYDETLYQNIAGTETANSNAGGYLFSSISDSKWMVYQGGVNSGSAVSPNTFYRTCTTLDANDIKFYVNGSLDITASAPDMTNNDTPLWIGCRTKSDQSGALIYFNGVQSNIIYVDKTPTADDIAYDAQHPEALLNMVISGVDDPNFSFGVSNIILCAPLAEGTDHTVYNIKTGNALSMYNFPTDNTQWTNADEQSQLIQKERYITNNHWALSKNTLTKTLKLTPVPMIGVFKTTSDNEEVTLPLHSSGSYDFKIDWGDGTYNYIAAYDDANKSHTYATAGEYTFTISGKLAFLAYDWEGTPQHLYKILQFGNTHITSINRAFGNCSNMAEFTTGIMGQPTQFSGYAQYSFSSITCSLADITKFDFSACTNINRMLYKANVDDIDFTQFTFSSATNLSDMLYYCDSDTAAKIIDCREWNLPQDELIDFTNFMHNGKCNTVYMPQCKVSTLNSTFAWAYPSTVDVSLLGMSQCTSLYYTFRSCPATIIGVENWDTSNVTNINSCFAYANNIPDVSGWDVSSVTDAGSFMQSRSVSTDVYDQILIKWGAQTVQSDVTIDFGSSKYTAGGDAENGRNSLINQGWTINDGGPA